jgi:hypothetical protein
VRGSGATTKTSWVRGSGATTKTSWVSGSERGAWADERKVFGSGSLFKYRCGKADLIDVDEANESIEVEEGSIKVGIVQRPEICHGEVHLGRDLPLKSIEVFTFNRNTIWRTKQGDVNRCPSAFTIYFDIK